MVDISDMCVCVRTRHRFAISLGVKRSPDVSNSPVLSPLPLSGYNISYNSILTGIHKQSNRKSELIYRVDCHSQGILNF